MGRMGRMVRMGRMDRRHALAALAAAGAGVLVGSAPDLPRPRAWNAGRARTSLTPQPPPRPPRPGYPYGQAVRAVHRPVHTLYDLRPAAPPNAVALTIDDGPHPKWTPMVLDLLAELQVPATFSLIGMEVKRFPVLVRRIVAAGHQVSDHTVTHPLNLPSLSAGRIREEIGDAHDRIAQTAGIAPKFFRAPGGAWSRRVLDTAADHGMISVDWQVDPRDWARPGTRRITDALLRARAGDILLCHDGGGDRSETLKALRTVLPALKRRGLTFVAL